MVNVVINSTLYFYFRSFSCQTSCVDKCLLILHNTTVLWHIIIVLWHFTIVLWHINPTLDAHAGQTRRNSNVHSLSVGKVSIRKQHSTVTREKNTQEWAQEWKQHSHEYLLLRSIWNDVGDSNRYGHHYAFSTEKTFLQGILENYPSVLFCVWSVESHYRSQKKFNVSIVWH